MREIVVSMQNTLLSEAVAWSLAETGEFRVDQVLPGKTGDTFSLCRAVQADILLMEVSRLPAYTLEPTEADRMRAQGDAKLQIRAAV